MYGLGSKIAVEQLAAVTHVGNDYDNTGKIHEVRNIIRRYDAMMRAIKNFECPKGPIPID
tara:strand:+ start:7465 stop:7644 length:180 start_codon:yes stop_codon:yes gene_type:complete